MGLFSSVPLPRRLVCFGATGHAVHVALDVRHQGGDGVEFLGYAADVDPEAGWPALDAPVMATADLLALDRVGVVVTVHDPVGRRAVYDRLTTAGIPIVGARGLPHLSHPGAEFHEGVFVPSTARVGHNTVLGRGVLALSDLVAHDVVVGEFTTLAMGSIVLGHVQMGSDVLVGAGALIHNGTARRPLRIGAGAIIGAGAVVDRDVEPGAIVVGPRAMPLEQWRALRDIANERTG